MRIILFLVLSVSFSISTIAQGSPTDNGFTNKNEAKNQTVNGLKQGKWFEYTDLNNNVTTDTGSSHYMLGYYKDSKLTGLVRWYFKNGRPYGEIVYLDGKKNGEAKQFFMSGKLQATGNFLNDKPDGVIKEYYDNGQEVSESTYTNGALNGISKEYHLDGRLSRETTYVNGVKGETKNYDVDTRSQDYRKQDSIRMSEMAQKMALRMKHERDSANAAKAYATPVANKSDSTIIDIQLNACLNSSQNATTMGMIDCTAKAQAAWDAELNKYYRLLQGTLKPDEMAKLKDAQIKWLAFRDAEFGTANLIYGDMQGTMWQVAAVSTQMQLVKTRALELKAYYEDLSNH